MTYSCSSRLDWEYRIRRRFNLASLLVFLILGILAVLLSTFCWMAATGDGFSKSLYWSVQTMTTVGYGVGFSSWSGTEQWLCIAWMMISVMYWGTLLVVVSSHLMEALRR